MSKFFVIGEKERERMAGLHSSFPLINAVIQRQHRGEIFMNEVEDYYIMHKAGFSEVFLKDDGEGFVNFIAQNNELPRYFHIYDPPNDLVERIEARTDAFNIRKRDRIKLTYNHSKIEQKIHSEIGDGFSVSNVTKQNFDSLSVFNLDLDKKFWNGKDDFIEHALGVFIADRNYAPVSICYAAAVSDNIAEIDVWTNADQRGNGLAKSIVTAFISKCASLKITPNWDCFTENIFSLKTALRLGFAEKELYKFISVYRK